MYIAHFGQKGIFMCFCVLIPNRADYQRISEEIRKRGRKPPPPLPPSDPRQPPSQFNSTLTLPIPPRDRKRTIVERPPPQPAEGVTEFDVSLMCLSPL